MTRRIRKSPSLLSTLALALAGVSFAAVSAVAQQPQQQQRPAQPAAPRPAQPAAPKPAQTRPGQPAQPQAAAAGPTVVNLKADAQQDWTKVCGEDQAAKKTICYTTRDFLSADNNQPIMAVAVYDVQNDPKKFVRFLLPLSFLLQPGIRFAVDTAQPVSGRFQVCFPNGCFAEAEVNEAFLGNLKKGTNIKVSVQNQVGQEIAFMVPLVGFGKAFDGAPIDPKVLEEQRKQLEEALQKQAEQMRQQQGQPGAAPAPAPAQPPKQ